MRGLALCLVAGALVVAGCGSSNHGAKAPSTAKVAASGAGSGQAGVSAAAPVTPASLCTVEGKGKLKRKCTAGLKRLDRGKVKNPRAACKGLSKKRTKGVKAKSPFAACTRAAAKLMAARNSKHGSGNGAADNSPSGSGDSSNSSGDGSSADSASQPICQDADGNPVPEDSPLVDSCTDPADAAAEDANGTTANDSSNDTSTDSTDTSTDTSTDSSDSSDNSGN